jgi:Methyltransferase domain
MQNVIKSLLNEKTKSMIKSSTPYQNLHNKLHSDRLAATDKRLDICAAEVASYLLQSGQGRYILRDKVCLEIGSGWLLTHSLVFYLLGAKKIYATDVYPLMQSANIPKAIGTSVKCSILDSLSMFEDREILNARCEKLLSFKNISPEVLQELNIDYSAPIDLVQKMPNQEKIDFIFSKSVLEHVPIDDIVPLLKNLVSNLAPDGFMFHLIHLLDHKDLADRPFDFFVYPQVAYPRELQTRWGNRLRSSQWQQIFSDLPNLESKLVLEWACKDRDLPEKIDQSIQYTNEEDLRISHIGVLSNLRTSP